MKTCLVVDDSPVIRKVARALLNSIGYEVVDADNGADALVICSERMPDAILLDWDLPDMSGFDFLVAFKQNFDDQPRPHIVYATTENDPIDISRSISAGADDYLILPFDRAIIEAKFPHAIALS